MKAYVCKVCGYVHFGEEAPERCPQCGVGSEMFELREETSGAKDYADEHKIGVAQGLDEEVVKGLREVFGEIVHADTKKNLMLRAEAEHGACMGKKELATRAKELGYDAIHDTVHEMCKDEARHGRGFDGLLKRYFNA